MKHSFSASRIEGAINQSFVSASFLQNISKEPYDLAKRLDADEQELSFDEEIPII